MVLGNDLVHDTRAWLPEIDITFRRSSGKEVVDLLVDAGGAGEVPDAADLGLNQMMAAVSDRICHGRHTSRYELQDNYMGGSILTGDMAWPQLEVRDTSLGILAVRVVQV